MEILKNIDVNWRERLIIRNSYIKQSLKLCLNLAETDSVDTGRGIKQGCCLSSLLFELYGEYLIKEALAELRYFKI